ncbi:jg4186 [Pararge aegeria aegeria]|uniref:Jg4186 protein n=1 Tax=Pararge aegeria aegeria TaxID=348720 RepID=A0A8S4SC16_9NEOP|nr:jg4186 [Pararge aegeria aegeria]
MQTVEILHVWLCAASPSPNQVNWSDAVIESDEWPRPPPPRGPRSGSGVTFLIRFIIARFYSESTGGRSSTRDVAVKPHMPVMTPATTPFGPEHSHATWRQDETRRQFKCSS